ncbi:MAG: tRNA (5-methylaminomethyl-2-thiouridine)(34)-methyltransferase MnmD [Bacteroidia bacterium]
MPELLKTADGSVTLYVKEIDETYHSRHGALQESMHVFIENGLRAVLKENSEKSISVLEIGFGTGLNALLTLEEVKNYPHVKFTFHSIEAYPIDITLVNELNFSSNKEDLMLLHKCEWNKEVQVKDNFILCKHHTKLEDFLSEKKFDLIYYDAFGPRAQAEMWEKDILIKTASFLRKNGMLVTYCAKGEVKRIFKNAGFVVETLKGPPGKREMIRVRNVG